MSGKTYRIGEAAAKLDLKTYVLRFWEMEFSEIAPIRTEKGQRLYREADIALLARIKYLLHERGLTIEGARRLLREEAARGITYTDATASSPGLVDEIPDSDSDDEAEEGAEMLPGPGTPAGVEIPPGPEHPLAETPVQGSLFTSGRNNDSPSLPSELPYILAELTAIRDILTF